MTPNEADLTGPGDLVVEGGRPTLVFERQLAHPIEKVWRAISQPAELKRWFPTDVEMDPVVGGRMRFEFRNNEGPTLEGEILEIREPSVFSYTWHEDVLRFELTPDGAGCRLTFSVRLGESDLGPKVEGGREARDGTGWHQCLDGLAAALDGRPPTQTDWDEVHSIYVERFSGS